MNGKRTIHLLKIFHQLHVLVPHHLHLHLKDHRQNNQSSNLIDYFQFLDLSIEYKTISTRLAKNIT